MLTFRFLRGGEILGINNENLRVHTSGEINEAPEANGSIRGASCHRVLGNTIVAELVSHGECLQVEREWGK